MNDGFLGMEKTRLVVVSTRKIMGLSWHISYISVTHTSVPRRTSRSTGLYLF